MDGQYCLSQPNTFCMCNQPPITLYFKQKLPPLPVILPLTCCVFVWNTAKYILPESWAASRQMCFSCNTFQILDHSKLSLMGGNRSVPGACCTEEAPVPQTSRSCSFTHSHFLLLFLSLSLSVTMPFDALRSAAVCEHAPPCALKLSPP